MIVCEWNKFAANNNEYDLESLRMHDTMCISIFVMHSNVIFSTSKDELICWQSKDLFSCIFEQWTHHASSKLLNDRYFEIQYTLLPKIEFIAFPLRLSVWIQRLLINIFIRKAFGWAKSRSFIYFIGTNLLRWANSRLFYWILSEFVISQILNIQIAQNHWKMSSFSRWSSMLALIHLWFAQWNIFKKTYEHLDSIWALYFNWNLNTLHWQTNLSIRRQFWNASYEYFMWQFNKYVTSGRKCENNGPKMNAKCSSKL